MSSGPPCTGRRRKQRVNQHFSGILALVEDASALISFSLGEFTSINMKDLEAFWNRLGPWYQSVVIGSVVTAGLSSSYIGFSYCCCFGVIAGGLLASQQYASRAGEPIEGRDGISLGVMSGLLGGLLVSAIELSGPLVGFGPGGVREMIPASWGIAEQIENALAFAAEMLWFLVELGVRLFLYPVLGLIGGGLGAAIFGNE